MHVLRFLLVGSLLSWLAEGAQAQPSPNPPPGVPAPSPPPSAATPLPPPQPQRLPPPQAAPPVPQPPAAVVQPGVAPPAAQPAPWAPAPTPPPAPTPSPAIYPTTPQPAAAPVPAPGPPPTAAAGAPAPVYPPQPQAAYPPGAAPDPSDGVSSDDAVRCALGTFCFGPVLTGGVLNVFGIGLQARGEYWGFGFDYQFIDLSYRDVDGTLKLTTLEGRVYPFGGAAFLSAGIAWQSAVGERKVTGTVQGVPVTVNVEGSTVLPLLKLGFGFMGRDGFVMGIDLGFGFRLNDVSVTLTSDVPPEFQTLPQYIETEAQIRRAAEAWIEWLPFTLQFNVIRFGYLF